MPATRSSTRVASADDARPPFTGRIFFVLAVCYHVRMQHILFNSSQALNPYLVGALAVVILVSVIGYFADKKYERSALAKRLEAKIRPYRDYGAGVLAFVTGIALLVTALHGQLLAANYLLPTGIPGQILRLVEAGVAVLLMLGLYTQVAAVGILALFVATFATHPPIEPIDYLNFVGVALFLLTFARGRYSLDWFLGKPILSTPEQRKWAYAALRFFTGFTLLWLALLKWRRPDLHLALMDKSPNINPYLFLEWVGLRISREVYVFVLSIVEATIGIFEMFGFLTRVASAVLVPIFLLSMIFLGPSESVGYLPFIGSLLVLFVYGDDYHKNREADRYVEHPGNKKAEEIS